MFIALVTVTCSKTIQKAMRCGTNCKSHIAQIASHPLTLSSSLRCFGLTRCHYTEIFVSND